MEAEWHSRTLQLIYEVLGWFAFAAWSVSFYPQIVLNLRRKSVVGLNFDYILLNMTKHTCYLIYNSCMYFIPVVQRQYHEKYGLLELIPVGPSDVAFSLHAVLLTAVAIYQIVVYEKGDQKVSMIAIGISAGSWFVAIVCLAIALCQGKWLWLVSDFNDIQVSITLIKYVPQAWMNYKRKSTAGYSIENILLDVSGGIANIIQMGLQSIDQGSIENFLGNSGKMLYSLIVLIFDGIFLVQHFVLYSESNDMHTLLDSKEEETGAKSDDDDTDFQDSPMSHRRRFINITERFPSKIVLQGGLRHPV